MGSDNIEAGLGSDIKGWCHISKEGGGSDIKKRVSYIKRAVSDIKGGKSV